MKTTSYVEVEKLKGRMDPSALRVRADLDVLQRLRKQVCSECGLPGQEHGDTVLVDHGIVQRETGVLAYASTIELPCPERK